MKVTLTDDRQSPKGLLKKGTVIDDPGCWRLVLLGFAEPADAECEDKLAELAKVAEGKKAERTRRLKEVAAQIEAEAKQEQLAPDGTGGNSPL